MTIPLRSSKPKLYKIVKDLKLARWLDRQLIRVMARYGEYRKGEISSFQIPAAINLYPQFMFHLRRGLLIQVFGSSPDETVFFRHCALRENVPSTLVMIQPTLDAYSFDSEPVPVSGLAINFDNSLTNDIFQVMLSVTSIQPNRILLLDTFFHVVIFHGETVAAWRKAGYHEKPEYANLKELLAAPQDDAKVISTLLSRKWSLNIHYRICLKTASLIPSSLIAIKEAVKLGSFWRCLILALLKLTALLDKTSWCSLKTPT